MAKYFDNFEASDIGDDGPAGWTKRWAAASSPGSFVREVAQGTPPFKKRYLATSQSAGTYGAVSIDSVDADADRDDVEVLAIYTVPASNADTYAAVVLRGSGSAGSENGYYFGLIPGSNQIDVGSLVGGAAASISAPAVTLTPGDSYWMRCRIDGTTIRARVWRVGSTEPTTWLVDGTNSAVTGAGWVGFWNLGNGKEGAWNCISVATASETAVTPLINTEYQAWLENPANQVTVLAELAATGYDSGGAPYTKTIKAYLSSAAYLSHEQDVPASTQFQPIIKAAPQVKREMGEALRGESAVGLGELVLANPVATAGGAGVRDDWLRCKWQASGLNLKLGASDWPLHDFRTIANGRVSQPVTGATDELRFSLVSLSQVFDVPVTADRFSTGPYANQFEPRAFGIFGAAQVEPPRVDDTLYDYYLGVQTGHDIRPAARVLNNQVYLDNAADGLTVASVSGNTLTASATHGMTAGWRVRFSSTPPSPLAVDTDYYVIAAGLTTTAFRLAATAGGTEITLTTTTTGADLVGYGWDFDASTNILSLVDNPAGGRITVTGFASNGGASLGTAALYDEVIFSSHGAALSANSKDAASFDALADLFGTTQGAVGYWIDTTQRSVREVLDAIAEGTFTWYGVSPEGLIQVGQLGLPSATIAQGYSENEVLADSLKLTRTVLPRDYTKAQISYRPWFLTGQPFESEDPAIRQAKAFLPAASYAGSTPPLDNDPALAEVSEVVNHDLLSMGFPTGLRDHLRDVYLKKLGVFEVTINHLGPATLSIGDTIRLTHPRFGWRTWDSLEASPDTSTTLDSRDAVVIGQDVNLSEKTVRLTLVRAIPGYYPEEDFAP